ncbi:MAG: heme-binding beta-barrel domain-containing protein [Actinomycetota bacterium]|nr:heme-binding beta-barrel domain-containing protein [Actinomycetota bacterium]
MIDLWSRHVGLTTTAKRVSRVRRRRTLHDGGTRLRTELWMATVGHELGHHLSTELHRDDQGRRP